MINSWQFMPYNNWLEIFKAFTAAGVVFFQSHFLLIQHIGTSSPDKSFHFAGGMASKSHIIAKRQ